MAELQFPPQGNTLNKALQILQLQSLMGRNAAAGNAAAAKADIDKRKVRLDENKFKLEKTLDLLDRAAFLTDKVNNEGDRLEAVRMITDLDPEAGALYNQLFPSYFPKGKEFMSEMISNKARDLKMQQERLDKPTDAWEDLPDETLNGKKVKVQRNKTTGKKSYYGAGGVQINMGDIAKKTTAREEAKQDVYMGSTKFRDDVASSAKSMAGADWNIMTEPERKLAVRKEADRRIKEKYPGAVFDMVNGTLGWYLNGKLIRAWSD